MKKSFHYCFLLFSIISILLSTSCESEKDPNFRNVIGTNGLKYHNGLIWVTDLIGKSITGFNPITGQIEHQYDFAPLGLSVDDLVFMDDETIVWTAPREGTVGKITPDGKIIVLLENAQSVNPIERRPGTDEVYIGFEQEEARVSLINIQDGSTTVVADNLPSINGFSFAEDGYLYAPLFDTDNMFSDNGGVVRIDIENGTHELLDITFPNQPNKVKLVGTSGIVSNYDGYIYVLESVLDPKVNKVNLNTLESEVYGTIPFLATDNIAINSEGYVYVSAFAKNEVYEFDLNGNRRKIVILDKEVRWNISHS